MIWLLGLWVASHCEMKERRFTKVGILYMLLNCALTDTYVFIIGYILEMGSIKLMV